MRRYWEMTRRERIEDSDRIAVMELLEELTRKKKRSLWKFIENLVEDKKKDWFESKWKKIRKA